jgi:hypothetical protein
LNEYGKKYEFTDYLPNPGALVTEADDFGMTAMFFKVYGERNGAHYWVKTRLLTERRPQPCPILIPFPASISS